MSPKAKRRREESAATSAPADHVTDGAEGQAEAGEIAYEAPRGVPANPQEVEGIDEKVVREHEKHSRGTAAAAPGH